MPAPAPKLPMLPLPRPRLEEPPRPCPLLNLVPMVAMLLLEVSLGGTWSAVLPLSTLLPPAPPGYISELRLTLCAMLDTRPALLPAAESLRKEVCSEDACVAEPPAHAALPLALPVGEVFGVPLGVKAASVAAATAAAAAKGDLMPPGQAGCMGELLPAAVLRRLPALPARAADGVGGLLLRLL